MFSCSNTECNEPVTCTGEGSADAIEYEDAELGWVQAASDRFDAKYFDPPLMLMDIPTRCPSNATEHLVASFKLCFADPGASLNSLRCALEAVLTGVGVKRFSFTGKKRHEIGLHQRIKLLNPKFKEQVDLLLAVKWLGNSGSHDGQEPNVADVMVTYDILEHALSEMFDSKTKRLKAVAKKVIAKKGRIKRNFGKALA